MGVITRFAPSPTGYLHVGGARTALFSWLYAKKTQGQFILRIEDTDLERSTEESVQAIFDGMNWLGLDHDLGPYYQTKRFDRYEEIIQQLLEQGMAYRCYCTIEELDAMREAQKARGEKPRYDGTWRDRTDYPEGQPYVIRFKNPTDGSVIINDLVRGQIEIQNAELDDLIIARTDGSPTYNFTVVVDDWDMNITHVIRGDDHINNTPRQINILRALGAEIPKYAHVPMILGDDGKRLSKRHGAVGVMQYRDEGYLPQALLNYLVRLGWSHGDQEIFSLSEMIDLFELSGINKAPSAFNTEKLNWLNQHYMKSLPMSDVLPHLQWHLEQLGISNADEQVLSEVFPLYSERHDRLTTLAEAIVYLFKPFDDFNANAAKKHLKVSAAEPLALLRSKLAGLTDWTRSNIQTAIEEVMAELEIGMGKIGMPLRVAVTGVGMSPNLDVICEMLGAETTLQRIDTALEWISIRQQQANQRS